MKFWVTLAAKLYPKSWRKRYAREFESLLNDVEPRWPDLLDILRGAIAMQLKTSSPYLKPAAAVTLVGALTAFAVSFLTPPPYVSSSVIRVTGSGQPSLDPRIPDSLNLAWQEVNTHWSLSQIIRRPSFKLYKSERNRLTFEEVIAGMRRDIRLEKVDGESYRISFKYPDPAKAQAVAVELTKELADAYRRISREQLQIMQAADLPATPLPPDRLRFLAWGLSLGALFGLLAASFRWRAKWTLKTLACGLAGCLAVVGVFVERNDSVPGCWYTSNATIRLLDSHIGGTPRMMTDAQIADRLQRSEAVLFSDAEMRKHLVIRPVSGQSEVLITFTDHDRFRAQQMVASVVTKLADLNFKEARLHHGSTALELLDPATLPIRIFPSLESLVLAATMLCMLLGGCLFRNRNGSGPATASPSHSGDPLPARDPRGNGPAVLLIATQ